MNTRPLTSALRPRLVRGLAAGGLVVLALGGLQRGSTGAAATPRQDSPVLPELTANLICFYDFDHPVDGDASRERDLGTSGTPLLLINGGGPMRVADGAHGGSRRSVQTQQVNPAVAGNDDWKAGVHAAGGVPTMGAFGSALGITVMGWVKPTGPNPALNSNTPDPDDRYGAVGLFGVLSGDSDGHAVRALLEIIDVSGTLRLVALGRRVDGANSHTLAATADWPVLLPENTWTHLAATFNFDDGSMAIYRNGVAIDAAYTTDADRWDVTGPPEPDRTSASAPAGIKIGGSFPQNTAERNPFNGRLDDLMFFNRSLTADQVRRQFQQFPAAAR